MELEKLLFCHSNGNFLHHFVNQFWQLTLPVQRKIFNYSSWDSFCFVHKRINIIFRCRTSISIVSTFQTCFVCVFFSSSSIAISLVFVLSLFFVMYVCYFIIAAPQAVLPPMMSIVVSLQHILFLFFKFIFFSRKKNRFFLFTHVPTEEKKTSTAYWIASVMSSSPIRRNNKKKSPFEMCVYENTKRQTRKRKWKINFSFISNCFVWFIKIYSLLITLFPYCGFFSVSRLEYAFGCINQSYK